MTRRTAPKVLAAALLMATLAVAGGCTTLVGITDPVFTDASPDAEAGTKDAPHEVGTDAHTKDAAAAEH